MMFQHNTPIEEYQIGKQTIYVKRDDLYGQDPAPHLAKLRGIKKYVDRMDREEVEYLGDLDTRVSKSGWGLAAACQGTNITPLVFYPQLKAETELPFIQTKAYELGATIIPLKAGRTSVLYSQARRIVADKGGVMLPMGLTLEETTEEVAKVINDMPRELLEGTIVVTTGTGTITAGIIKGLTQNNITPKKLYAVSCGMSIDKQAKVIGRLQSPYMNVNLPKYLQMVLPAMDYYDKCETDVPFPCNQYYDAKAWLFLKRFIYGMKGNILFWNIGD